jgi:hypothetical protein
MIKKQFQSFGLNTSEFKIEQKSELRHEGRFSSHIRVLSEILLYASFSIGCADFEVSIRAT